MSSKSPFGFGKSRGEANSRRRRRVEYRKHDRAAQIERLMPLEPRLLLAGLYLVTNTSDSGPGSLRQTILDVDSDAPTQAHIKFDIPGSGVQTISPLSALPTITSPVFLDGTTQNGWAANTGAAGLNTVLTVFLDGGGLNSNGLTLGVGGNTIGGLAIGGFKSAGINLGGTSSNLIAGDFLGVAPDGATADANNDDIFSNGASNNTIGGTLPAARNLISASAADGIFLLGGSSNLIAGNMIGLDATGSAALANVGAGVHLQSSSLDTIGGLTSASQNVISENANSGVILYDSSNSWIVGNLIGLDATGLVNRGNQPDGIAVGGSSTGNVIGDSSSGAQNVISGNTNNGISLSANGNFVLGNTIGEDVHGHAFLPSTVALFPAENSIADATGGQMAVRGTDLGFVPGEVGTAFHFFGSYRSFIQLTPTSPTNPLDLTGTSLGIDAWVNPSFPNGTQYLFDKYGIQTDGLPGGYRLSLVNSLPVLELATVDNPTFSLTELTPLPLHAWSHLAATYDGSKASIYVNGALAGSLVLTGAIRSEASQNAAIGNQFGFANGYGFNGAIDDLAVYSSLDANQIAAIYAAGSLGKAQNVGNGGNGVQVTGSGNTIGSAGAGNFIAGNVGVGVQVLGVSNEVAGNVVGIWSDGTAVASNEQSGVQLLGLGASGNTIGGINAGAGNTIAGHSFSEVDFEDGATNNLVAGNRLGAGNGDVTLFDRSGINFFSATGNTIGGPISAYANVLLGNGDDTTNGIAFNSGAVDNLVEGNSIGTNATGSIVHPYGDGIALLGGTGNTIGGAGTGNRIASSSFGIYFQSYAASNVVQGNTIGLPLRIFASVGLDLAGTNNLIGGSAAGAGNVISGSSNADLESGSRALSRTVK